MSITRDEWLSALQEADLAPPDDDPRAVTIAEFQQMFGLKRCAATRTLQELEKAGKAKRTNKMSVTPAGRRIYYVAYRLLDRKKK
jgi:hypothetical protein